MGASMSVLVGISGCYYYGMIEISIKKDIPPAIFFPIIAAFALALVLIVLSIISMYKYGWKADKTRQKLIDEIRDEKGKRLKSDAAWEYFKGVFDYAEVGFQGNVLARYDLAQDKQAYDYTRPLAGFSNSPSCSICGIHLIPTLHHQTGWAQGYHCPNCKEKVTNNPIQTFNELARTTFEATQKKFIRSYNAQNNNS